MKVENGIDPEIGNSPQLMQIASEGIREAMEHNSDNAVKYGRRQFRMLIVGAVFYIAWHVTEMVLLVPES